MLTTNGTLLHCTPSILGWDYNSGSDRPLTTFDSGSLYDVQTIDLWARNSNGTIPSIDISTSTDNLTYSTPVNFASSWAGSNPALDSLDVSALGNAWYYRLTTYSTDWSFLYEVQFRGEFGAVNQIPESSTATLLGCGLAVLAWLRRRRK